MSLRNVPLPLPSPPLLTAHSSASQNCMPTRADPAPCRAREHLEDRCQTWFPPHGCHAMHRPNLVQTQLASRDPQNLDDTQHCHPRCRLVYQPQLTLFPPSRQIETGLPPHLNGLHHSSRTRIPVLLAQAPRRSPMQRPSVHPQLEAAP